MRDAADPAADEAPVPDPAVALVARVVLEHHVGGARRRRTRGAVVDRVPADRRHHVLGLEPLGQVLPCGRREQERRLLQDPPVLQAVPRVAQQERQVPRRAGVRVRRRPLEERHDAARDAPDVLLEPRQRPRVGGAEPLHVLGRAIQVVVEPQVRAVGVQVQRGTGLVDDDAAPHEPHLPPDGRAEHREHVRAGRGPEPGRELLGDAGAADERPSLEHHRPQAGAREPERGDEPVVAPADHDRVVPPRVAHRAPSLSPPRDAAADGRAPRGRRSPGSPRPRWP
jgi:hypothetical protein